jgi:holliday junction DNA helicase RuvA
MFEYLQGNLIEKNPAFIVLDVNGIGYSIHVSINTYSRIGNAQTAKLFVHQIVREDAHLLFGFADKDERELFRLLISVSGVGANTGILFLSSLSVNEIKTAIISGDIDRLKSVKGIGLKTAQRIVVELKDKLGKEPLSNDIFMNMNNTVREEALSALTTLGFMKKNAEKVIDSMLRLDPEKTVEQIIKDALKQM